MEGLFESLKNFVKFYFDSCHELYKELDIENFTNRGFYYLKQIGKQDGITFSKLSEDCKVSKPTITEVVGKFIEVGLCYKEQSKEDGRIFNIYLTEKGKVIANTNTLELEHMINKLEKCLSNEELETLVGILEKIK